MKVSIIIPAYNEEKTIELILKKVVTIDFGPNITKEIIVINDCSRDKTLEKLKTFKEIYNQLVVLNNEKNLGKSKSVVKGILKSTGDVVVIQDADLEYDPNDLVKLYKQLVNKNLDFVYGNRFGGGNKIIYKSFYFGNHTVSFVSNLFTYFRFKKLIPDMEVCYKMIKGNIFRDIAKNMTANSNFGFEPELTAKLTRYKINAKSLQFDILPISYFPRTIQEGKKIRWKDGIKAIFEIIKYNLWD